MQTIYAFCFSFSILASANSGQAGLALWLQLPRFFCPLANMAKAWLIPAFRPGFDPSLPRSGRVPDAREMLCRDRWSSRHCSCAAWVFYLACLHLHILLAYSNFKSKQVMISITLFGWRPNNNGINASSRGFRVKLKPSRESRISYQVFLPEVYSVEHWVHIVKFTVYGI